MTARSLDLEEAVEELVADGDCIWLGNFGSQLFAVAHELIRRRRRDLHVVAASGGLALDQLIGAGAVREVTFAHCWSAVGPHPAGRFRAAWQSGTGPVWHELSIGTLMAALGAAAAGVPFACVDAAPGTGYAEWSGGMLGRASSAFGDATVVRALAPDVAFVHAERVDAWGNATLGAPAGDALVAVQAARQVVVVAEERVEGPPAPVDIPGVLVDAAVVAPGAVAPDGVAGRYPRDVAAYAAYARAARTEEGFAAWLDGVR